MTAAEAGEVCQHWWMKEALDIFVERQQQKAVISPVF
jgi:predicted transcriptional regulator